MGDGELPASITRRREVRADLLRYLILGGCKDFPVNGVGVNVSGAYISGILNLSYEKAKKMTGLFCCRFENKFYARQTKFDTLVLSGCALPALNAQGINVAGAVCLDGVTTGEVKLSGAHIGGQFVCDKATFSYAQGHALNAQGLTADGGVFLKGFTATGEVSLSHAHIGGQLNCAGATFSHKQGRALNAQGINVTGPFFLKNVTAIGEVLLDSAKIDGQLNCIRANFSADRGYALNAHSIKVTADILLRNATAAGKVNLSGAQVGGQLFCEEVTFSATGGHAFSMERANVRGGLFWRKTTLSKGRLNLSSAHVGDLTDDLACWPEAGKLILNGFTYNRISAASTDTSARLAWLAKGSTWNGEFFPQPYTQLAKVLREMGHDADAREVLAQREKILHAMRRERWREQSRGNRSNYVAAFGPDIKRAGHWVWDQVFLNSVIGYGFHPFRSLWWLIALWLSAAVIAHLAWEEGSFAPNSGPILLSDDWQQFAMSDPPTNPAALWSEKGQQGQDWESFSPFAYAADLVIPIVDIGQTAAWAPSTTRESWGYHLWWLRWIFTLAGWIVTALGAAAITGIIRRD